MNRSSSRHETAGLAAQYGVEEMNAHSVPPMALPTAKTMTVDGIESFYHVAGSGEPIVLV